MKKKRFKLQEIKVWNFGMEFMYGTYMYGTLVWNSCMKPTRMELWYGNLFWFVYGFVG